MVKYSGKNITSEMACLEQVLAQLVNDTSPKSPCQVFVMSDRAETLKELESSLANHNRFSHCQVVEAVHMSINLA